MEKIILSDTCITEFITNIVDIIIKHNHPTNVKEGKYIAVDVFHSDLDIEFDANISTLSKIHT